MGKKELRIMLIDDDEDDNFFHQRVIAKVGLADQVIVQESALEALEYLRQLAEAQSRHPDIIFLDINMPKMNGWEFIEKYNEIPKTHIEQNTSKIFMLSTSFKPENQNKKGAAAFFKKPLTQAKFLNAIEFLS
ncbi:MAG: response regulator [Bacteroidia bacterium]